MSEVFLLKRDRCCCEIIAAPDIEEQQLMRARARQCGVYRLYTLISVDITL